eukprot:NODE_6009_length_615_cov_838.583039_g5606_i0.p1 GENE.NODE_6009_length_615_cov_838.583039_g5606_i0~~NODE_6009_length_615_cov_838.583039_g5606_i0.p1  ORF type:complete len:113 (+),score=30.45 NODE_6009_length_615_cov_838.583039_g5606_i0:176-514(+)
MSRIFEAAEVAEHSEKNDCYIIINDKVYDTTKFMSEHPGGGDIILDHAGRDASNDFEAAGHSKTAYDMLEKYYVGDLKVDPNARKGSFSAAIPVVVALLGAAAAVATYVALQ